MGTKVLDGNGESIIFIFVNMYIWLLILHVGDWPIYIVISSLSFPIADFFMCRLVGSVV